MCSTKPSQPIAVGDPGLTPSQQQAVEHLDGPLLVLAGPGSGKTRVITRRITRMLERGVHPQQLLAITFTNKAAREMAQRVEELNPGRRIWVSTFHKFCVRLLRRHGEAAGLKPNFTICDTSDQKQLVRLALESLDIDTVTYPPARIAARISNAKNALQTAEIFVREQEHKVGDHLQSVVAKVYPAYQKLLLNSNAVDFDDLLLHVVTVLSENPELRAQLDERFRYVLVDEYQDTNLAQYQIVAALSHDHPNLCVTGDPDQSIYGWRGAEIGNILRFEADYPNATVIRLEQNFRSTKRILDAADSLIAHNTLRKEKRLITDNAAGEPPELLTFSDGRHESSTIASAIRSRVEAGENIWSDFAIFYRVNALSREMERALTRYQIPYQVAAGSAFYDRAEIRDMLAYLRLLENPDDEPAFRRVVNTPARGIGKKTLSQLTEWADSEGIGLLQAAANVDEHPQLKKRAKTALRSFARLIEECGSTPFGSVADLLLRVADKSRYTASLRGRASEQDQQRLANVEELLTAAHQYDQTAGEEASLEGFLEETSLVGDADSLDEAAGQVTMMTLHAAKGLEFPVVYLLAVEENLIPHERSLRTGELKELEEERRLLFVGMTRAMQRLYLTQTRRREFRGRHMPTIPSMFLVEMELKQTDLTTSAFEIPTQFDEPSTSSVYYEDVGQTDEVADIDDVIQPNVDVPPKRARKKGKPLLTTGADLLNGTSNSVEVPSGFSVGMTVRHPRYGRGTVVQVSGMARKRMLTVEFQSSGESKTFVASKCPLQPVGLQ